MPPATNPAALPADIAAHSDPRASAQVPVLAQSTAGSILGIRIQDGAR
ncbi:MAG: hypothetical protein JO212_20280 [Acetobacteraceae bacterium]|nr:hypothetical protein [Acetobacteraceae bacterium]